MVLIFSTCRKAEENNFKDGEWRISTLRMNKDTADALRLFLPIYSAQGSKSKYDFDFADNKIVLSTYYFQDTIVFTKEGEWELREKNEMYLYVDNFINGTFSLTKLSADEYNFTSTEDSNYIEALDSVVRLSFKLRRTAN